MEEKLLLIDEKMQGMRLDAALALAFPEMSRTRAAALLDEGCVEPVRKSGYMVKEGEEYVIRVPEVRSIEAVPEDIPLDILYEDSDVIVVNKPKGMVVHPDNVHVSGTLVNALLYHCKDLSGIGGELRPGIVHRIDMDTTGSVIACKNDAAHESISRQLKEHSINRKYLAVVIGDPGDEGRIEGRIGRSEKDRKKMAVEKRPGRGKEAITLYRTLERFKGFSLVECTLLTGRTHQIRVHMASKGHPLLGDEVYGNEKINRKFSRLQGQCLHARILGFKHPVTGEYIETEAPLPEYFQKLLTKLRSLR